MLVRNMALIFFAIIFDAAGRADANAEVCSAGKHCAGRGKSMIQISSLHATNQSLGKTPWAGSIDSSDLRLTPTDDIRPPTSDVDMTQCVKRGNATDVPF